MSLLDEAEVGDVEEFLELLEKDFSKETFEDMAEKIIGPEWPTVGMEWVEESDRPELKEKLKKYL